MDDKQQWPDADTWLSILVPAFTSNPKLMGTAARLWFHLSQSIKKGPEGVQRALEILDEALRVTYQFTPEFQAMYYYFKLSLTGVLPPADEPLNLIQSALERNRPKRPKRPDTKPRK